jgi:hypothetical protein
MQCSLLLPAVSRMTPTPKTSSQLCTPQTWFKDPLQAFHKKARLNTNEAGFFYQTFLKTFIQ